MSEPTPMPTYWALAEEVTHLHGQLDKLKAENAKLRELCETFGMIANDAICDYYELAQANADACELGVEL